MSNTKDINRDVIATSLGWKILERFFSQGCSIIVQIILARLLLPSDFGSLAIILAIVNYLSVFVQSGLSAAIVQKKELTPLDINTIFSISFGIAGILFFLLFFSSPYIADYYNDKSLINPIRVSASLLFLCSLFSIYQGVLSRKMEFKTIAIRSSIALPAAGVISIIMAYYGFGLWSLIVYNILHILFACIALSLGNNVFLKFQISKESALSMYSFSIKIIGANMISGFSDLFRTMSIGKRYSTSNLAYYDRAYYYSYTIQQVINSSIQSVLLPVFSRKQEDIITLKNMARQSIKVSMFIMIPFLMAMIILAKPIVLLLLTEKWAPCVPYLMLFLAFRLAGSMVGIDKQVYLALGKSSIIFYFEVVLLIANITMLLITIPISVKAIAIGAFVVEYLSSLILVFISKNLYSYQIRERIADLYRPVMNSLIMMLIMWAITLSNITGLFLLIIQILTGFVIYILLSYLTKDSSLGYIISIAKSNYNRIKQK